MSPTIRPQSYQRFAVGTTVSGYEVIDTDGRPVSPEYPARSVAQTVRDELNEAFACGRVALMHALGALDEYAQAA